MTIAQRLSSALAAALLMLGSVGKAEDGVPVTRPEPITIRVLDGKSGASLGRLHLQFVAGYDNDDLQRGLWNAEAITDGHGRANMPDSIQNFPFVAVWVAKHKLCAAHGRSFALTVDRIRYQGLSTSNHCGTTVVDDTPEVLNVFVKARHGEVRKVKVRKVKVRKPKPVRRSYKCK